MSTQLTSEQKDALLQEIADKYNEGNEGWNCEATTDSIFGEEVRPKGFEFIDQDGGGEGGSEYCEMVFKWNGQLYKITYNYYSHQGYEWDYGSIYTVEAKEKTVTVYE